MPASETKLLSARLPGATFGLSVELTRRWLSSLESVADGHPFLEIAQTYAVSLRFGIAEGPAVFRVLLRSAPPVGVSWRMAYTMETSRITIAYLLLEYSSSVSTSVKNRSAGTSSPFAYSTLAYRVNALRPVPTQAITKSPPDTPISHKERTRSRTISSSSD